MFKLFFFFLGFIISTISLTYIITYLNLLSIGYTYKEYLLYILTRYECYSFFIGIIMFIISVNLKGDILNDFYL